MSTFDNPTAFQEAPSLEDTSKEERSDAAAIQAKYDTSDLRVNDLLQEAGEHLKDPEETGLPLGGLLEQVQSPETPGAPKGVNRVLAAVNRWSARKKETLNKSEQPENFTKDSSMDTEFVRGQVEAILEAGASNPQFKEALKLHNLLAVRDRDSQLVSESEITDLLTNLEIPRSEEPAPVEVMPTVIDAVKTSDTAREVEQSRLSFSQKEIIKKVLATTTGVITSEVLNQFFGVTATQRLLLSAMVNVALSDGMLAIADVGVVNLDKSQNKLAKRLSSIFGGLIDTVRNQRGVVNSALAGFAGAAMVERIVEGMIDSAVHADSTTPPDHTSSADGTAKIVGQEKYSTYMPALSSADAPPNVDHKLYIPTIANGSPSSDLGHNTYIPTAGDEIGSQQHSPVLPEGVSPLLATLPEETIDTGVHHDNQGVVARIDAANHNNQGVVARIDAANQDIEQPRQGIIASTATNLEPDQARVFPGSVDGLPKQDSSDNPPLQGVVARIDAANHDIEQPRQGIVAATAETNSTSAQVAVTSTPEANHNSTPVGAAAIGETRAADIPSSTVASVDDADGRQSVVHTQPSDGSVDRPNNRVVSTIEGIAKEQATPPESTTDDGAAIVEKPGSWWDRFSWLKPQAEPAPTPQYKPPVISPEDARWNDDPGVVQPPIIEAVAPPVSVASTPSISEPSEQAESTPHSSSEANPAATAQGIEYVRTPVVENIVTAPETHQATTEDMIVDNNDQSVWNQAEAQARELGYSGSDITKATDAIKDTIRAFNPTVDFNTIPEDTHLKEITRMQSVADLGNVPEGYAGWTLPEEARAHLMEVAVTIDPTQVEPGSAEEILAKFNTGELWAENVTQEQKNLLLELAFEKE